METMKTTGKEFFYSIPGLGVPKHDVNALLVEDIEFIADWIPKNADSLSFLLEHHIDAFMAQMKMLHEIFVSIYALWLAKDISRILTVSETTRKKMCRKLLGPFITNAHTLAIDIHMAQKNIDSSQLSASYNDINNHDADHYDEVARCKDVINSIKLISDILASSEDNPDFEKILDVAQSINELRDSKLGTPLFESIILRDVKYLKKSLAEILTVYFGKIDAVNSTVTKSDTTKKVLIVDDVTEILAALTSMLEGHYHVLPLADGDAALEFLDSGQSPDAFILDIDMPVMDGLTLAKKIRDRKEHSNTPILFLTSNSEKETVIKAWQYNTKAFIVKPANRDIIISKLSSCLK